MVAGEFGVHKAPAVSSAKCYGIHIWSADRSGITATRAGTAIRVDGAAGWTNFIDVVYTDNSTSMFKFEQDGTLTVRSPTGNHTSTFTTNPATTTGTITVSGQTGAAAAVNAVMQAASGGQITLGAQTNHPLVLVVNNTERLRIDTSGDITVADGGDFILNTTTGSKIGTATTQKIAFWNSTPIVQPSLWADWGLLDVPDPYRHQNGPQGQRAFRDFIVAAYPGYAFHIWAERLIALLQRVADGELNRLIVCCPPTLGKSLLVSKLFPAYWVSRYPTRFCAIASYSAELAYAYSREARHYYRASAVPSPRTPRPSATG